MSNYGNKPAFATVALVGKFFVWSLVALSATVLLLFLFKLAPYLLAPLFVSWGLQTPPATIDGKMSRADVRARAAELRAISASPQAAANSAKQLTVVGLQFDHLRKLRLANENTSGGVDALAAPYRVALNLSGTDGDAIVALSEQAIAWSIVPPPGNAPRAIFGIESRLFPEFEDPPKGVLAGFRTGATSYRAIAQPLQPLGETDGDIAKFCASVKEWADYFSLPLTKVNYLLVADATDLAFGGEGWTSDGRTLLELDNVALRQSCGQAGGRAR